MRTLGVIIKTVAWLMCLVVTIASIMCELKSLAVAGVFAMTALFVIQTAEIFLGYQK